MHDLTLIEHQQIKLQCSTSLTETHIQIARLLLASVTFDTYATQDHVAPSILSRPRMSHRSDHISCMTHTCTHTRELAATYLPRTLKVVVRISPGGVLGDGCRCSSCSCNRSACESTVEAAAHMRASDPGSIPSTTTPPRPDWLVYDTAAIFEQEQQRQTATPMPT